MKQVNENTQTPEMSNVEFVKYVALAIGCIGVGWVTVVSVWAVMG